MREVVPLMMRPTLDMMSRIDTSVTTPQTIKP
jgi:hypothetical protein